MTNFLAWAHTASIFSHKHIECIFGIQDKKAHIFSLIYSGAREFHKREIIEFFQKLAWYLSPTDYIEPDTFEQISIEDLFPGRLCSLMESEEFISFLREDFWFEGSILGSIPLGLGQSFHMSWKDFLINYAGQVFNNEE